MDINRKSEKPTHLVVGTSLRRGGGILPQRPVLVLVLGQKVRHLYRVAHPNGDVVKRVRLSLQARRKKNAGEGGPTDGGPDTGGWKKGSFMAAERGARDALVEWARVCTQGANFPHLRGLGGQVCGRDRDRDGGGGGW